MESRTLDLEIFGCSTFTESRLCPDICNYFAELLSKKDSINWFLIKVVFFSTNTIVWNILLLTFSYIPIFSNLKSNFSLLYPAFLSSLVESPLEILRILKSLEDSCQVLKIQEKVRCSPRGWQNQSQKLAEPKVSEVVRLSEAAVFKFKKRTSNKNVKFRSISPQFAVISNI